jgi:hypothetical protein
MYDDDDLSVLDAVADLESPLDDLEPVDAESEAQKPNPEAMLALLTARRRRNGCWRRVHFVNFRMSGRFLI